MQRHTRLYWGKNQENAKTNYAHAETYRGRNRGKRGTFAGY